ncbi:hypothetical protein [Acinetobacter venetianus]|uniref:hypothetical protein n=1 Tax=Acinetobacter venetianus TaxID=52133 RepID=UPI00214FED98|nr:hypothetical protein [Acinetobacter venetianus]MCR4532490.1 hypothetical protein [Acinetobacter venetianus]
MKITRENLNSFDHSIAEICEYFRELMASGGEPTPLEVFAMGFLALKDARFNELFSLAPITHTEKPQFSSEFNAAMEKYEQLRNECGEDSEEARKQLSLAMLVAPDWFVDMAHKEAKDMGLLPKATECMPDGTPVYTVEQIATHFGISVEEATKAINDLKAHQEDMGLEGEDAFIVDPSLVQKIQ